MLHALAAPDTSAALTHALAALLPAQDILDGRVDEPAPPAWCEARGWSPFLLSLPDEALHRCETQGLAAVIPSLPGAPASLSELAHQVETATRLPVLRRTLTPPREALRSVGARKQRQLGQLLGAVATMAEGAARIVDVGAGAGHFTRLAAELFDRDALGVDHDKDRLRTAATLLDARARDGAASARRARFELLDACRDPIALGPDDLAVGLHACGAVGDRLVEAVGLAGCSLALVSCCFQKIPGATRAPLSPAGAALHPRREILGLASLTSSADGVETSLARTLLARQARFALFRLLRARGLTLSPGEAMRGINRRRAHGGLAALAAPALLARGLAPATEHELRHHEDEAARLYGTIRRLSLPRDMLARLLEVSLVLDRAAALQSAGLAVRVLSICEQADTPRNVCIFASRDEARLPSPLPPCASCRSACCSPPGASSSSHRAPRCRSPRRWRPAPPRPPPSPRWCPTATATASTTKRTGAPTSPRTAINSRTTTAAPTSTTTGMASPIAAINAPTSPRISTTSRTATAALSSAASSSARPASGSPSGCTSRSTRASPRPPAPRCSTRWPGCSRSAPSCSWWPAMGTPRPTSRRPSCWACAAPRRCAPP